MNMNKYIKWLNRVKRPAAIAVAVVVLGFGIPFAANPGKKPSLTHLTLEQTNTGLANLPHLPLLIQSVINACQPHEIPVTPLFVLKVGQNRSAGNLTVKLPGLGVPDAAAIVKIGGSKVITDLATPNSSMNSEVITDLATPNSSMNIRIGSTKFGLNSGAILFGLHGHTEAAYLQLELNGTNVTPYKLVELGRNLSYGNGYSAQLSDIGYRNGEAQLLLSYNGVPFNTINVTPPNYAIFTANNHSIGVHVLETISGVLGSKWAVLQFVNATFVNATNVTKLQPRPWATLQAGQNASHGKFTVQLQNVGPSQSNFYPAILNVSQNGFSKMVEIYPNNFSTVNVGGEDYLVHVKDTVASPYANVSSADVQVSKPEINFSSCAVNVLSVLEGLYRPSANSTENYTAAGPKRTMTSVVRNGKIDFSSMPQMPPVQSHPRRLKIALNTANT